MATSIAKLPAYRSSNTTMNGIYTPSIAPPHEFQSSVLFDRLSHAIPRRGTEMVDKIQGVICFRVKKMNKIGVWVVDLKHGSGGVMFDPQGDGDVTFSVGDEDLMKMAEGDLDPKWATVRGKLKISGDYGLAMTILQELKSVDLVGRDEIEREN